jgi:hypothetical protein
MDDFGDREGDIITPSRKVHEDAIRPGNGYAGRHRTIEGSYCLEVADRRIVWECLCLSHDGEGSEHHSKRQG